MGTYRTLFLVAFIYKYAKGISLCFGYFSVKWQVENVSLKLFGRSKGLLVLFWIFENEKLFRLCDWTRIRVPTMSTSRPSFSKIIASPELEIYSWIPDKLLRKVKKNKNLKLTVRKLCRCILFTFPHFARYFKGNFTKPNRINIYRTIKIINVYWMYACIQLIVALLKWKSRFIQYSPRLHEIYFEFHLLFVRHI